MSGVSQRKTAASAADANAGMSSGAFKSAGSAPKAERSSVLGAFLPVTIGIALVWAGLLLLNRNSGGPGTQQFQVFTPEELSQYKVLPRIYLALLGRVYDVSAGSRHYGPDGTYGPFAGRDASRSYVTGEMGDDKLTDDVSGMSNHDWQDLAVWVKFYEEHKTYKFVGVVAGRYFDAKGEPTAAFLDALEQLKAAEVRSEADRNERNMYPPCDSRWAQGQGTTYWCGKNSGGIERDWVGLPRKLALQVSKEFLCVCVPTEALSNPHLSVYEGCTADAIECQVPDAAEQQ